MPHQMERQQATDALHQAFLVSVIAEAKAELNKSDSEDSYDEFDGDREDGTDSDTSSGSDEPQASTHILEALVSIYVNHYNADRKSNKINKTHKNLHLLLHDWKHNHPDVFRSYARMSPTTFDKLVESIGDDPVFHNNANMEQMDPAEQILVMLFRFGHYGNAASTVKTALFFGLGYGTVSLCTKRVLKACLSNSFRAAAVHWPDEPAKECAKQWVENRSCSAWQGGFLFVNGTLIPLYARPAHFGNSWFDRKSNYSMNLQLINDPDL
ncbi:hypothetical protein C8J56DRAFT_1064055 [Mycena floridula]|nr:hypothetical protein C8J56DRAFT_1064055 [Mycena floridula]